jgi:hypothetical protein
VTDIEDSKAMLQQEGSEQGSNIQSNVFQIYSSPESFESAGIFNGGLDIGVDPT